MFISGMVLRCAGTLNPGSVWTHDMEFVIGDHDLHIFVKQICFIYVFITGVMHECIFSSPEHCSSELMPWRTFPVSVNFSHFELLLKNG